MKTRNHLVSFNKNNNYNHSNDKYTYENINTHFYTYNWTNTTDGFNTFLFMVIDNNSTIKTLNICVIKIFYK